MAKISFKILSFIIIATITLLSGCDSLVVENKNQPDLESLLTTPEEVIIYTGNAFKTWYNGTHGYDGPAIPMAVMADQMTCSWGCCAMLDLSSEPRKGWNNSIDYAWSPISQYYWQQMYLAYSVANDALKIIKAGKIDFGDDAAMLEAWCRFIQGISLGYIALTFDKGILIDENTNSGIYQTNPYQEISKAALNYLDQAIQIADHNIFEIPSSFINGLCITNIELSQMANSFAARIMVYTSRTSAANSAIDWTRLLKYAENGIIFDMNILGNDFWYDAYKDYATYPGWGRIDHRIINLMDNDYPSRWPSNGIFPDPQQASSIDARLELYFEYLAENDFLWYRGYYHFSHYRLKRFDYWQGNYHVAVPDFLKAENDLFIAEALVHTGDINGAIDVINAGTRTTIGNLPPLPGSATEKEVLEAIFYERDIELCFTGMGIGYFDMRRRDMLQSGTILHWPLPASELQLLNMDWYTIDGKPDGVNISNGHWVGKDGLVSPP